MLGPMIFAATGQADIKWVLRGSTSRDKPHPKFQVLLKTCRDLGCERLDKEKKLNLCVESRSKT